MTSKHSAHNEDHQCYTDFALQEFAMGRLSDPVSTAIQEHLTTCEPCRDMESEIRLEQEYFSQLVNSGTNESSDGCLGDEQLGQFVDNSLNEADKSDLESHLSLCPPCRGRLIELYQQMREAMEIAQASGGIVQEDAPKPALVLTMTKRKPIPEAEQLPRFNLRDTGTDV